MLPFSATVPFMITDSEVCIIFACPGMLNTLNRYCGPDIAFAVDTKMKVLDRGMGVTILSLLVKDELRPTRLPKTDKGCQTQSHTCTSRQAAATSNRSCQGDTQLQPFV